MEGASEGVGIAGLLVEDEDSLAYGTLFGGASWGVADVLGEPLPHQLDALERVAAVDAPGDAVFVAGFAAAAPFDGLEALFEVVVQGCVGDVGEAPLGEEVLGDGDCEGGVGLLEGGREA